jgi:hypothetical protein
VIFLTVLIVSSFAVRRSRDLGRRVEARASRLPSLRVSVLSRIFKAASVATKGTYSHAQLVPRFTSRLW